VLGGPWAGRVLGLCCTGVVAVRLGLFGWHECRGQGPRAVAGAAVLLIVSGVGFHVFPVRCMVKPCMHGVSWAATEPPYSVGRVPPVTQVRCPVAGDSTREAMMLISLRT
jgi:hypothetical protein